jgi:hypothetical protein
MRESGGIVVCAPWSMGRRWWPVPRRPQRGGALGHRWRGDRHAPGLVVACQVRRARGPRRPEPKGEQASPSWRPSPARCALMGCLTLAVHVPTLPRGGAVFPVQGRPPGWLEARPGAGHGAGSAGEAVGRRDALPRPRAGSVLGRQRSRASQGRRGGRPEAVAAGDVAVQGAGRSTQQGPAGDGQQPPLILRSDCCPRLRPSVRLQNPAGRLP